MFDEIDLPEYLRCDSRPGIGMGYRSPCHDPAVDLTSIAQISEEDRIVLGDANAEGTPAFRAARDRAMAVYEEVRAAKEIAKREQRSRPDGVVSPG